MKYVIDACNLIFQDNALEAVLDEHGFQAAKTLLVSMLARFARAEKLEEIEAVFDGSEKAAHLPRRQREALGKVLLVFADPREDADRHIIALVEDAKNPGAITVVSNDKFIIRNVRRAGGKQLSCRQFLSRMRSSRRSAEASNGEEARKYGGTLTKNEMEEWMQYFGITDE